MITITTVIHANTKHNRQTQIHRRLRCSGKNVLLLASDFGSSIRGERQFLKVFWNHTMLTTLQHSAHLLVHSQFLNTLVGPNFSTSWSDPYFCTSWSDPNFSPSWLDSNFNCLPQWQTTQLSAYMAQNQLPTASFSKSSNSPDHRFRAWRHSHTSTHFLSGVYYDNCDFSILCARP